jgi:hypothetical protein
MGEKPKFDPNKPFTSAEEGAATTAASTSSTAPSAKPKFDPSKSFEEDPEPSATTAVPEPVKKKEVPDLSLSSTQADGTALQPSVSDGGTSGLENGASEQPAIVKMVAEDNPFTKLFSPQNKLTPAQRIAKGTQGPTGAVVNNDKVTLDEIVNQGVAPDFDKNKALLWDKYEKSKSELGKQAVLDQINSGDYKNAVASQMTSKESDKIVPQLQGNLIAAQTAKSAEADPQLAALAAQNAEEDKKVAAMSPEDREAYMQKKSDIEQFNKGQNEASEAAGKIAMQKEYNELDKTLLKTPAQSARQKALLEKLQAAPEIAKTKAAMEAMKPETVLSQFTPEQIGDYGDALTQHIKDIEFNNPGKFQGLVAKASEGKLTDDEKYTLLTDAMMKKADTHGRDLTIYDARGYNQVVNKYGKVSDQFTDVTDQMNKIHQQIDSGEVKQGTPEFENIKNQYTDLSAKAKGYLEELKGIKPDDDQKIQDYLEAAQGLKKTSDDFSKVIWQFPDKANDYLKQEAANVMISQNPIAAQIYETPARVWNSVVKAASGLVEAGKSLADLAEGHDVNDYTQSDKMMESFSNFIDKYATLRVSDKPLFDEKDGKMTFNIDRLIPNLATTATDMMMLIGGGREFSSAMGSAKYAEDLGLFSSSFVQVFGSYKKDAIDKGMSESDAYKYATTSAAIQSALELISPNENLMRGPEFKKELGEAVSVMLKKEGKVDWGKLSHLLLLEPGKENIQEAMQNMADKVVGSLFNKKVGLDKNHQFDVNMSDTENAETATLTTASTILLGFATTPGFKAEHDNAKYLIGKNLEATTKFVIEQVKNNQLSQADAEKILAAAGVSSMIQGMMPKDISELKKNQISPLLEEKQKLEEDNKKLDPLFVKKNNARITEIENSVREIYERPDKQDNGPTSHPNQEKEEEILPEKNTWYTTDHAGNKAYFKLDDTTKQPVSITEREYNTITEKEAKLQEQKREQQKTETNEKSDQEITDKGETGASKISSEKGSGETGENASKEEVVETPAEEKVLPATTETEVKPKTETNAVQEQETGKVLQREQEDAGAEGGKRGGVESGEQGTEVTGKSAEEEKIAGQKAVLSKVSQSLEGEAKRKVDRYGLNYDVYSNKEADDVAKAAIDKLGVEEAVKTADDKSNGVTGSIRTMIYANAIDHFFKEEKSAKTDEEKDIAADKQAEYADKLDQYARDSGRAISAVAQFYKMSPLGIQKQQEAQIKSDNQKQINKMAGKQASLEEVKKQLGAVKEKMEREFSEKVQAGVTEEINKLGTKLHGEEVKKKIDKFFDSLMIKPGNTMMSTPFAIPLAVYNGAVIAAKHAANLTVDVAKIVNRAVDYIKENHKGEFDEKGYREDLEKKIKQSGLVKEKSGEKAVRDEQMAVLNRMFPKKRTEDAAKRKTNMERMLDAFNAGALEGKEKTYTDKEGNLTKQSFEDLFYERFGLLNINNPEFKKELKEHSEAIAKTPAGSVMRAREMQKTMNYIADQKVQSATASIYDKFTSRWYANILSSYESHIRNVKFNSVTAYITQMGLLAQQSAMKGNLRDTGKIFQALIGASSDAMAEAKSVVKTGLASSVEEAAVSNILERQKGGLGRNIFKYPGRLLKAEDVFFTIPLREAKQTALAFEQTRKEYPDWTNKEVQERVNEVLGHTPDRMAAAENQAKADVEAFYGKDWEKNKEAQAMVPIRKFELMEQSRPQELREASIKWARRALLTNKPEGSWAAISDGLQKWGNGFLPIKFVVPFVNVPLNIVARMFERGPAGYINAIRGAKGFGQYREELTPDERKELYIKATNYTVGIIALAGMQALGGGNDKDDAPLVVTGKNTADYEKNKGIVRGGGLKEYTVYVYGHEIFNYKDTPLAALFAPVGYIRDYVKYSKKRGTMDGFVNVVSDYMSFAIDQSSMKGISGLISALSPDKKSDFDTNKAAAYAAKVLQSMLLPMSGLVKAADIDARGLMGLQDKRSTEWWHNLLVGVPFADSILQNRFDHLGRPIKDAFNIPGVPSVLDIEQTKDPFYKTFKEKAYYPSFIRDKTVFRNNKEYDMSGTELNDYNKLRGDFARKMIEEKYHGKETVFEHMQALDKADFKKAMDKVFSEATLNAKIQMFGVGVSEKQYDESKKKEMAAYKKMTAHERGEHLKFMKQISKVKNDQPE